MGDALANVKISAPEAAPVAPVAAPLNAPVETPAASQSSLRDEKKAVKVSAPVAAKAAKKWEVQKAIQISWGGMYITLQEGQIVSEETHGPGSIQRMRDAKVILEEVK